MEKLQIEEAKLPVAQKGAATKKASKYESKEIIELAHSLEPGSDKALFIPTMEGSTAAKMLNNIPYYLNKRAKAAVSEQNPIAMNFVGRIATKGEGEDKVETGIRIWRKA